MTGYCGAGKLNKSAKVLELQESRPGTFGWVPIRDIRVAVEFSQKKNLFSTVGVGARDASLVVWRQEISLHNAIKVGEDFLFLTGITERNRNQLDIKAALCSPVNCQADMDRDPHGICFPGILTEKYVGHDQPDFHSEVTTTYVLVTPKSVDLRPGSWLVADGQYYLVLTPHLLDPYKNEFEIRRKEDC